MNKYSKKLFNFLASIWKSFSAEVSALADKEKSVWACTPVRAFGRGFTLIELLVVVLVIGILAAVALPVYNRSVQKSRMSDALNVLDIAASKQQANYIAGEGYASSFNDLSLPVKGLEGNIESSIQGVKAGNFTYTLQNTCVVAAREEDDVTIYRNFNTDEIGCQGEGCKLLDNVVPAIPIGCEEYASSDEGDSGISAPTVISCSFDKCYNADSNSCVTTNSTCIQGRIITQACGNGGVQMRKCLEGCPNYWSDWSECINQTCKESERPASIDRAGCGYCKNGTTFKGVRTRSVTCNTSTGAWSVGAWSSCVDENTCSETSCSETNSCECASSVKPSITVGCGTKCGNGQYMGIQTRTVTCNRTTGEWFIANSGDCVPNLACCPGETSTGGCLWGVHKTCQANGQWGECNYKFCEATEPESSRECAEADNVRTCGIQTRSIDCDLSKGDFVIGEWGGSCTAPKYNKVPETVQFCGTCGSQTRTCQKTCDGLGQCDNWITCVEKPVPPTSQSNSPYCSTHGTKNSPAVCDNKAVPSYSVDFENTGTCACYTYYYTDNCSVECSAKGKYWNTGSCEMCTNSPVGRYWTGNGITSEICPDATCTNKPLGYYWVGHGGTSSTCATAKCTNVVIGQYFTSFSNAAKAAGWEVGTSPTGCAVAACTNKPAGYYWTGHGGTSATGCAVTLCSNKETGKYWTGHGGTSSTCPSGNCTNAVIGQYYTGFSAAAKDASSAVGTSQTGCPVATCTNTNPGQYWTTGGGITADSCVNKACTNALNNGTYYSGHGGTSATGCAASTCTNKPIGQYWTDHGAAGQPSSCPTASCTNKTVGKYWSGFGLTSSTGCAETTCTNTTVGKYWTSHGGTSSTGCALATCTNTTAGKYWTGHGGTSSTGCALGNCTNTVATGKYYSGHGGTSATGCAVGDCTNKPVGKYWTGKGTAGNSASCPTAACTNTTAGKYWTSFGNTSSTGCTLGDCTNTVATGKYYSGHGGTSATGCAVGDCTNKPVGKYWTGKGTAGNSASCPTAACTNTTAGKYWTSFGSTSSTGCTLADCTNTVATGKYYSGHGGTSATSCAVGDCTNKPVGQYWTGKGTAGNASSCPTAACTNKTTGKYWTSFGNTSSTGCSEATCTNTTAGKYWTGHGGTSATGCALGNCTNKPANSTYTGHGGTSSTGCAWKCDAGYTLTNGCCNKTETVACPAGYPSGTAYKHTTCGSITYDYSQCYKDTGSTACSQYSSTYNQGVTTRRDWANAAGNSTRLTQWPSVATQCYYDKTEGCSGFSSKYNVGSTNRRYYAGGTNSWTNPATCYYDSTQSGLACPSGYTTGGSVATGVLRHYSNTSGSADSSTAYQTYNYYNCYANGSQSGQSCPSGYTSGGSVGVKNYRTYCNNTATSSAGACGTTRQTNVTYNYYNCYANGSQSGQSCPSGYTTGGSVGVKNYRTYCGNTATATVGACGTTRQTNVTYNYYNCYTTGSQGGQSCPSGYTSGGNAGVKNYKTYCNNTATASVGVCGTTRQEVTGYTYSSCYNEYCGTPSTASGQACPSGYTDGGSVAKRTTTPTMRKYYDGSPYVYSSNGCGDKMDYSSCYDNSCGSSNSSSSGGYGCPSGFNGSSTRTITNTPSTRKYYGQSSYSVVSSTGCGSSTTYNLTGCYKDVSGWTTYGSGWYYNTNKSDSQCVKTSYRQTCTNTAASATTSCSTSNGATTYDHSNCNKDGGPDSGYGCPSGYTDGGNLAKRSYTTHLTCTNSSSNSCSSSEQVGVTYDYSLCYDDSCGTPSSTSAGGYGCPSGYSGSSTRTITNTPSTRKKYGESSYSVVSSTGCGSSTTYNLTGCYKDVSGWTSYGSGWYYNSSKTDSQCVKTSYRQTCTNTGASGTSSCSTSNGATTYNHSTCYKDGGPESGYACPSGYTDGGNLAKRSYRTHLKCTNSSSNSCSSSEQVDPSYDYSECYQLYCGSASTSTVSCPSGYTSGGNLGKRTITPKMKKTHSGTVTTYSSTGCGDSYNYSSCYTSVGCTSIGSGYSSGTATKYYGNSSYSTSNCVPYCPVNTVQRDTSSMSPSCSGSNHKARRFCLPNGWTSWSSCSSNPTAPSC